MDVTRRDWAVILARGDSARMGRPKGLCRLPDDETVFLTRISRLYERAGLPTAVVTRPELAQVYRERAPEASVDAWVLLERGGGTAASCLAAVSALSGRATHLWLHPVDLPLVADATLGELAAVSARFPDTILVPWRGERRGHPVVTPLSPWTGLSPDDHPGSMRRLILERRLPARQVEIDDEGIHRDFDEPGELAT